MTWHNRARLGISLSVFAALVAGCGSSSKEAKLEITAPTKGMQLTLKGDDVDTDRTGLQYDVTATATDIAEGTLVLLTVGDQSEAPVATVDKDGSILFDNVTLPPGTHSLRVATASNSVHSADDFEYTYKALVIDAPRDGLVIGFADDKDMTTEGVQVNVTVNSYAIAASESIALQVDGTTAMTMSGKDKTVFSGVTLSAGAHTLKAVAGSVESNPVRVTVMEGCATIEFVSPTVPGNGDRLTLGGGDKCPKEGDDFTLDVVVSTNAGEGSSVELKVNDVTQMSVPVKGASARFPGVILNHYSTANKLSVIAQGAQGVTCKEVAYPSEIYLDCGGADCSLGGIDPRAGVDGDSRQVLYLNKSMRGDKGFDVRVDSDQSVLGKKIQLIVDRDDRHSLTADPTEADSKVSALFSQVELADGVHTVEARCEDNSGNVKYSGEASWVVDTKSCTVDVTSPEAGVVFVPSDDIDSGLTGVQVEVRSTIGGTDCRDTRANPCKPADGIAGVNFEAFDGNSALMSSVTLETDAEQTLCVEVQDRAGNIGLNSVAVKLRSSLPQVLIESPNDGDSFNSIGDANHRADSQPNTPTICNADLTVLCSEVSTSVELFRGDTNSPLLATAQCTAPAEGDPALPAGYAGRARFSNVAFLASGSREATIVAKQAVAGSSDKTLSATSSVMLTGLCQPPRVDLSAGCPASQMELPAGGADLILPPVYAGYSGNVALVPDPASLTVTGAAGGLLQTYSSALTGSNYMFSNVSFGHASDTITMALSLVDSFANTTTVSCQTTLVTDLPKLMVPAPTEGQGFGPGQTAGCVSGVAGKFGVPVQLTLDKTTDRTLTYAVGSGSPVTIPIAASTAVTACVPVDEGFNTITFKLNSTTTVGYALVTRHVNVNTLKLSIPPNGTTLVAADDQCDPGFGAHVQASVDPIHAGKTATVSNGTNMIMTAVTAGMIDTCLPLAQGPNTITVSINGTTSTIQGQVVVLSSAPTHSIPIKNAAMPAANQYRTGKVVLSWDPPATDFGNQLQGYLLRCAATPGLASSSPEVWWNNAETVTVPLSFAPPATSVAVDFRIGETRHCALRARDAAGQLTPLADTKSVGLVFREQAVESTDAAAGMGTAFARVGDVNGDTYDDILVGGLGYAYLYFGAAGGLTSAAPSVTFVGQVGQTGYLFGSRVAGIGDFNRDGRNDFAIAHPSYTGVASRVGAVYIYYGRVAADPWPAANMPIDSNAGCVADVCFFGQEATERLGYALAGAGDFDNDNHPDLAVSAPARDVTSDTFGGRLYVLSSTAYEGSATRMGSFFGTTVNVPGDNPRGFYVDASGIVLANNVVNDVASVRQLGGAIAPVGNVDAAVGSDLLVSALGAASGSVVSAKLLFLSGRTHNGSAPLLKQIPTSELVTKDTGTPSEYGFRMSTLTNFMDTSDTGVPDVAVASNLKSYFHIYLGDRSGGTRYSPTTRITMQGNNTAERGVQFGTTVASSFVPSFATPGAGDLDGDTLDEVLVSTTEAQMPTLPGAAFLFYGDTSASRVSSQALSYTTAHKIDPAPRAGTLKRSVQYVGDVTGDGAPDLVVADPDGNSGNGGFTVLY